MNVLSDFRDKVKENAKSADPKVLFKLTDELRDDILPDLGIRLEDMGKGNPSMWKLEDKETFRKEREEKQALKKQKEEEKEMKKELEQKKKSTSGNDWFRTFETDSYSKFDQETGLPTHDNEGNELSQKILNQLK